jgi:hypothetical protein
VLRVMTFHTSNRVTIPGLADFCFPSGILSKRLRKTKSNSNLLQVVYSQSYHHEPENAYVFLLTTAEREFLYGVCVVKHESVQVCSLPCLFQLNATTHESSRLTLWPWCSEQAVVFPSRLPVPSNRWTRRGGSSVLLLRIAIPILQAPL